MKRDNDKFKDLFGKLPDEQLPKDFRFAVMKKVHLASLEKQRKTEVWSWILVSFTALIMLGLGIFAIWYVGLPDLTIRKPDLSSLGFYCFIGICALILLGLDYILRRHYYRNRTSKDSL